MNKKKHKSVVAIIVPFDLFIKFDNYFIVISILA